MLAKIYNYNRYWAIVNSFKTELSFHKNDVKARDCEPILVMND